MYIEPYAVFSCQCDSGEKEIRKRIAYFGENLMFCPFLGSSVSPDRAMKPWSVIRGSTEPFFMSHSALQEVIITHSISMTSLLRFLVPLRIYPLSDLDMDVLRILKVRFNRGPLSHNGLVHLATLVVSILKRIRLQTAKVIQMILL